MKFSDTAIPGAIVVDLDRHEDERGFFARTYCADEFAERGIELGIAQAGVSFNRRKGTLRGMHFQVDPAEETKLIRCTAGAVWDVIVDMRPGSPAYLQHFGIELSAANHRSLYLPAMCAHGFQTLADDTEVSYQFGDRYRAGHERGVAFDDPALGIEWPLPVTAISDRDRSFEPLPARERTAGPAR